MSDLTDFLLARIVEDEASAEAARIWYPSDSHDGMDEADWMNEEWWRSSGLDRRHSTFVVRQSPSRVLAECEAKRQQIEHLIRFMEGDYAPWNETQLQIMATVYADHPDYREEWKP